MLLSILDKGSEGQTVNPFCVRPNDLRINCKLLAYRPHNLTFRWPPTTGRRNGARVSARVSCNCRLVR